VAAIASVFTIGYVANLLGEDDAGRAPPRIKPAK
jgi:hypothetical protein